jgi:hypothetical protein
MNKKTNTVLFILGATVFNLLVTALSFVILLVVYVKFIVPLLPEESAAWGFPIIFVAAIAIAFLTYRMVINRLMKKIDLGKYFDPIFAGKQRNR